MRILRLKVTNWRHLPQLELDLDRPVTVIHGPNRAGKSTLADAVRKGLFDNFKGKADEIIPWSDPGAVPSVEIEFNSGGRRYLIEKKFSKNKAGGCELYEIRDGGERRGLSSREEVTDEVLRLLKVGDKRSGVPSMLWVRQGLVEIPAPDRDFTDRLHSILGGMTATDADDAIRREISQQLGQWFTDAAIKNKTFFRSGFDLARLEQLELQKGSAGSPLNKLAEQIEADQSDLAEVERRLAELEQDMDLAAKVRDELREARRQTAEAEHERDKLQADEDRIAEKRQREERARSDLEKARAELEATKRERSDFARCISELAECEAKLRQCLKEVETGAANQEQARRLRDGAREEFRVLRAQLEELEAGAQIEIKQRLLECSEEIERVKSRRRQVRKLEKELYEARSQLGSIVTPEEKDGKKITKLLKQRTERQAKINASQLHFTLSPEKALTLNLVLDHGPEQGVDVRAGETFTSQARQSLALFIPEVGRLKFGRGEEDEDLEKLAREDDKAGRELASLLAPLGIDPALPDAEIIAEIATRQERTKDLERQVEEKTEELKGLGDLKSAELDGELQRLNTEQANLIADQPVLQEWNPSRSGLAEEKKGYAESSRSLKAKISTAERKLTEAQEELDRVSERQSKLGNSAAEAKVKLKTKQEEAEDRKTRHESLDMLDALITEQERDLVGLEEKYEQWRLTPEERNFSERLREAQDLVTRRMRRENDLDKQSAALEERLRGLEGLHGRKTALEQKLDSARRDRTRMETSVKALATLALLYDQLRDRDVESLLQPVTELLGPWLRELYGTTAKKLVFGSELQAEKIEAEGQSFTRRDGFDSATSYGELEQLGTLVRLAYGAALAREETQLVILDDPLAHSDNHLRRKMNTVIEDAVRHNLQVVIFTCNREGFDRIGGAEIIDLPAS